MAELEGRCLDGWSCMVGISNCRASCKKISPVVGTSRSPTEEKPERTRWSRDQIVEFLRHGSCFFKRTL